MNSRMKRTRLVVCAVGMLTAAALALSTSPSSAANSYNGAAYVNGGGNLWDDWGDEGILSTSSNTSSNATCLWQKVLWAEGELAWSQIDGIYGPATRDATRRLQAKWLVQADGVVGKSTFGSASSDGLWNPGEYNSIISAPDSRSFIVWKDSQGRYNFYDRSGNARLAGYNYLTCS